MTGQQAVKLRKAARELWLSFRPLNFNEKKHRENPFVNVCGHEEIKKLIRAYLKCEKEK